jgi:undecaprenyl-phosphate 4-deoxy-4-formamido-L-arabinose transferase
MLEKTLISFVIPCYRSELTIEKVYEEIVSIISERAEFDYEILTVNDYSPDNVLQVLRKLAAKDEKVRVLDLAKNFGKHCALLAGLHNVRGELVVILDDDYQCPVNELWRMVDAIVNDGYDCVTAQYRKKKESAWKRFGASVNTKTIKWLIDPPNGIDIENYVVFRRYICDEIVKYPNPYPYIGGLIMRSTHNIKMIPMDERERGDNRRTGFTFMKSLSLYVNGLTAFSVKPLRLASILGFVFAVIGLIYGIVIIIRRLLDPLVPLGYSSIMAVLLFAVGMIMLLLGVIGEYLGRIYISLNRSPQFVIRETVNVDKKDGSEPDKTNEAKD